MTTKATAPALTEDGVRELSRRHAEPDWLLQRRLDAWRAFEAMAMPDPLAEEWRRTDLSRFDLDEALAASGAATTEVEAQDLPAGVIVADLHAAAHDHESLVQEHLHTLVLPTEWKLGALQAAAWQEGALIYVPRGVEVTLPLGLTRRQMGAPLLSHLLIVAEAGSSVTVIQESTEWRSQRLVASQRRCRGLLRPGRPRPLHRRAGLRYGRRQRLHDSPCPHRARRRVQRLTRRPRRPDRQDEARGVAGR